MLKPTSFITTRFIHTAHGEMQPWKRQRWSRIQLRSGELWEQQPRAFLPGCMWGCDGHKWSACNLWSILTEHSEKPEDVYSIEEVLKEVTCNEVLGLVLSGLPHNDCPENDMPNATASGSYVNLFLDREHAFYPSINYLPCILTYPSNYSYNKRKPDSWVCCHCGTGNYWQGGQVRQRELDIVRQCSKILASECPTCTSKPRSS